MKIKVVGKAHLQGTSKKTGNPYDFIQVHYLGRAPGVIGDAALTLNLDPNMHPYEKIAIPSDCMRRLWFFAMCSFSALSSACLPSFPACSSSRMKRRMKKTVNHFRKTMKKFLVVRPPTLLRNDLCFSPIPDSLPPPF